MSGYGRRDGWGRGDPRDRRDTRDGGASRWRGPLLAASVALALAQPWWGGAWGRFSPALPRVIDPAGATPTPRAGASRVPTGLPLDAARALAEGRMAIESGDLAHAVRAFTLAAQMDPLLLESYRELGEACLAAGDAACAGRAYRALARAARWTTDRGRGANGAEDVLRGTS